MLQQIIRLREAGKCGQCKPFQ